MAVRELELRVATLEQEMARLKSKADRPWWEKIAGTFDDDPTYEEAMALGRAYRQAQRPKPVQLRVKKH
jgi:acyl-CoA thioesterase